MHIIYQALCPVFYKSGCKLFGAIYLGFFSLDFLLSLLSLRQVGKTLSASGFNTRKWGRGKGVSRGTESTRAERQAACKNLLLSKGLLRCLCWMFCVENVSLMEIKR